MPHQVSAGGAGAEDGLGSSKDPEKLAHEAPNRGRISRRPGKLAAAGLVLRVFPGNSQAGQKPGHGFGHLGSQLIQKARDKEFDAGFPFKCCKSKNLTFRYFPFVSSTTENCKPNETHPHSSCRSFITDAGKGERGKGGGLGDEAGAVGKRERGTRGGLGGLNPFLNGKKRKPEKNNYNFVRICRIDKCV
jgi:hypothetical protein